MTTIDPPVGDGDGWAWFSWRDLVGHLGFLERAFARARASGKAEDDVRLRIFFVMAMFAAAFLALAIGASRAALFSQADKRMAGMAPTRAARRPGSA